MEPDLTSLLAAFTRAQTAGLRAARAALDPSEVASAVAARRAADAMARAQTAAARAAMEYIDDDVRTRAQGGVQAVVEAVMRHSTGAVFAPPRLPDIIGRVLAARVREDFDGPRMALARWTADARQHLRETATNGARYMDTGRELLDRLAAAADARRYAVERIVRTEAAYVHNAAANEAVVAFAGTRPRGVVFKRWTERIDDQGRPLDSRVAQDSFALHGQLTEASGAFVMPRDQRVDSKLWGRRWYFPPNRPHDRAVVLPWQRGWPGGGWLLRGDRRLDLR